jgi:hypothetical protein
LTCNTSAFSWTFTYFCILLLYFFTSLFTHDSYIKSCLRGTSISIIFVCLFVSTNLCILPILFCFISSHILQASPYYYHILFW